MALEREVKLRFDSPDEARSRVQATGARLRRDRRLQRDLLLDTAERTLEQRRSALRVRAEEGGWRLTFKGPPRPDRMKVREEHETPVGDGEALLAILHGLGLRVTFRYEKYREEYEWQDAIVAIDETPVGTFVEIEGREDAVDAAARALGRGPADYITRSYRALFLEHRAAAGGAGTDMTFAGSTRA